ncbi:MAG: DUF1800 domain-containing protein [Planctomycetota bacterium]
MQGARLVKCWVCVITLGALMFLAGAVHAGTFRAQSYGELSNIKRKVLAAQFLSRTTFGPTPAEIDSLALRIRQIGVKPAFEEWINQQISKPVTHHHALAREMVIANGWQTQLTSNGAVQDHNRYKDFAWWHIAIRGEDQLRQRVAWALSQIFVVAEGPALFTNQTPLDTTGNPRWLGLADYYDDVLVNNAFGSYRQLLTDMTYHPCMGVWLTSLKNKKPSASTEPDENYSREVMQLFSIGLVERFKNGVVRKDGAGADLETYDNETIKALARVFTGMVYNNNNPSTDSFGAGINLHGPMDMYEQEHDFGQKIAFGGNLVIPARTANEANARQDISDVLDYLAYEHSTTSPFLCRLLIQRLVKSNPSKAYIRRVAKVFDDSQGDFAAVVKAIFLDREALQSLVFAQSRSPLGLKVSGRGTEHSRLREPVLRYTAVFRAFNATTDASSQGAGDYLFIHNGIVNGDFNQAPHESPSVFNFYLPDYQPPLLEGYATSNQIPNGRLFGPEFEIMTAVQANRLPNQLRGDITDSKLDCDVWLQGQTGRTSIDIFFDFSTMYNGMLGANGVEPTQDQVWAMIDYLDLVLCAGTLGDAAKGSLVTACMNEIGSYSISSNSKGGSKEQLVRGVVWSILVAPECAVAY